MKYLYRVAVGPGLTYDCVGDDSLAVSVGDKVVLKCERYQDFGQVTGVADSEPVDVAEIEKKRSKQSRGRQVEGHRIPEILRLATPEDLQRAEENDRRAESMQRQARDRIAAHGLSMKLIHTHCSLDRRLAVFQFCAEGRVDFRELLRDLSHQFRIRVELRQVGVRDEAAIQGGIGACGRPFCCSTFLRRFKSINVKMAKVQGLSLNPVNISGACGRLKCCLEFEYEQYKGMAEEARARAKTSGRQSRALDGGDADAGGDKQQASPTEGPNETGAERRDGRSRKEPGAGDRGDRARTNDRNRAGGRAETVSAEAGGQGPQGEHSAPRRRRRPRRNRGKTANDNKARS